MIFTTVAFWIYIVIVYAIFLVVPNKIKSLFLLLASYYFYAHDNQVMLILILILTLYVYLSGLIIDKVKNINYKKIFYYSAIAILVLNLAYFKYVLFLLGVMLDIGIIDNIDDKFKSIYLPLAISFFTFEFIHYLSDVFRGDKPIRNYIHFSLFPAFFPTMIAGPIKRYQDFIGQLNLKHWNVTLDDFKMGVSLIILGSFYKITLSDSICSPIVNKIYDKELFTSSYDVLIAMISFSYQIFFDFQGYSLIAIGLALLFGIKIPINFNSPYLAINPSDFWRRWHITLSQWLRDYIFIPLGGSRVQTFKIIRNLMITMLIGGIWHGAGYNFLIWGLLHGLALAFYKMIQILKSRNLKVDTILNNRFLTPLWIILTFAFVTITWVFFRIETFSEAILVISSLFTGINEFKHINELDLISILFITLFMFGWKPISYLIQKLPINLIGSEYIKVMSLYMLLIITMISIPQVFNPIFIYFRF